MTRKTLGSLLLAALAGAATPAISAGAEKPVRLVEAHDGTLAAVVIAASGTAEPVLLFDPQDADALRDVLALLPNPRTCVVRAARAGTTAANLMAEIAGQPCTTYATAADLARATWVEPKRVVVFEAESGADRVRAEGFAAATGSALLPLEEGAEFTREFLAPWQPEVVYLASDGLAPAALGPDLETVRLVDAVEVVVAFRAITDEYPSALILTNPADLVGMFSPSSLSMVSGLYAALHKAPVFPVPSADPEEIERFAGELMRAAEFLPERILLVGDELAMRSHRIPDPVLAAGGPEARGGGTIVRTEIFSEIHHERPQVFPVGRIIAENAVFASLTLVRRLHVDTKVRDKPVIFLANADEIFPLGETISRTTVSDLRNLGVRVHAYYRGEITPEISQQALGQTDVLVWEGHPRDLTLEERGGIAVDTAPKVTILQGCYTLDRNDPLILIEKGTQAIVATSAAIYSAPGSGFARALFDSIAHDGADLGTAVRDARNFLLALALLRREMGFEEWHKTYRAALAFALWGDPSYRAPIKTGRPDVRATSWELDADSLTLTIPQRRLREVAVGDYRAEPVPRVMYGGLVFSAGKTRTLRDMFSTVQTVPPERRHACAPDAGWSVVSLYAELTQQLTVLARPDWESLALKTRSGKFRFALAANAAECAAATVAPQAAGATPSPAPVQQD